MPIIEVPDPADTRLALYRNVPDADLLRDAGVFVAEGRLVVRRLLRDGRLTPRSLLVTAAALASLDDPSVTHPALPVYVVAQDVMNGITGFNLHRGCLALATRPPRREWAEFAQSAHLLDPARGARLVVLEQVGNADNVGSIFRSAAALGAEAVLLGPRCADPLYRKAIRTSMGAALSLPYADAAPWPGVLDDLAARGITVVGLTPDPGARPVQEVAAEIGRVPVALLLGHEGDGLTPAALAHCRYRARIPITADVDSLNVAVAAAIALAAFGPDPALR